MILLGNKHFAMMPLTALGFHNSKAIMLYLSFSVLWAVKKRFTALLAVQLLLLLLYQRHGRLEPVEIL